MARDQLGSRPESGTQDPLSHVLSPMLAATAGFSGNCFPQELKRTHQEDKVAAYLQPALGPFFSKSLAGAGTNPRLLALVHCTRGGANHRDTIVPHVPAHQCSTMGVASLMDGWEEAVREGIREELQSLRGTGTTCIILVKLEPGCHPVSTVTTSSILRKPQAWLMCMAKFTQVHIFSPCLLNAVLA